MYFCKVLGEAEIKVNSNITTSEVRESGDSNMTSTGEVKKGTDPGAADGSDMGIDSCIAEGAALGLDDESNT